ncbi:MAG TPA: class IV adenylate cyclase [Dehalococcoidia bacterium]|jgi:predicted adenylyl cyclase CyaB|nr:class IV adenylate cyclase [Dehalococcoidia bacterium]
MRNLEFKARLDDPERALHRAEALGASLEGVLPQTDTYFKVSTGRLKLRETVGQPAELVYYQRDEDGANRASDYDLVRIEEPDSLLKILGPALSCLAVVRKHRTLLRLDATRIHLDNVEGLGSFIEFEVPVAEDEAAAKRRIDWLIRELGFEWSDCIRASYLDLMLPAQETQT